MITKVFSGVAKALRLGVFAALCVIALRFYIPRLIELWEESEHNASN